MSSVRECLGPANAVEPDESLLEFIPVISESDYVLVKAPGDRVAGIVTAADLSVEFGQLTEPFLLLGEIERYMRKMIEGKISPEEIQVAVPQIEPGRCISSVHDLTLGECILVVERPEYWEKLGLRNIERKLLTEDLKEIRLIRNKVMHFSEDDVTDEDRRLVRRIAHFVRNIDEIRSSDRGTHQK